jgi:rod shape determining protein RodA
MVFQSESNVIKTFNTGLFVSFFVTFCLGVITLYSATYNSSMQSLYKTQLIWFGLGCAISAVIFFLDVQVFEKVAYPFYATCLALLTLVLFVGRVGGGSQRWIDLKVFHLQPSEIAKLAIVFTLARYFANEEIGPPYNLRRLAVPGLLVAPFFLLILLQPDLGTAGVLFLVASSIVLFMKVDWRSIVIVVVLGVITVPLAYQFVLRDYQRDRVKTFLNPGRDARGSGYNAMQCKIAVGSGQVGGKGYLKGTQSQLRFIPEQHTDFIFSVYAEERGFLGGVVLVLLYISYCIYGLRTVARARDKFQMLLAFGMVSIIFWHVFINMGMVIGLLPIVGVGLPFFSYGGSSLMTFMIATAILLNISRKKYIF